MKIDKKTEYSVLIIGKIGELFEENESLMEEFEDDDNITSFIHALANMTPTHVYNELTGHKTNMIDFNHIANKLVFQNSKRVGK